MMGRGSAVTIAVAMGIMVISLNSDVAVQAKVYTVGDANGWTFGVHSWPQGINFLAGDQLVFKYPQGAHNVIRTNKNAYDTCVYGDNDPTFESGNDVLPVNKGDNYFICGFGEHCQAGMKIAVVGN